VPKGFADGRVGEAILAAVREGLELPADELPEPPEGGPSTSQVGPLIDLLKVLLKIRCAEAGVAQKLVAGSADLERLAVGETEGLALLQGWRREIFGNDALALMQGRIALAAEGGNAKLVRLDG
jgi:ribonuclease D